MRIAFFGSPAAATVVLERLLSDGHEIVAAVTQPDKPVGRKQVPTPCAVAAMAREKGLPLLQPTKLRTDEFRSAIAALAAEVAVVVAYGRIIPGGILAIPPRGFLNVHFSLLPRHRGAAPVAAAILAGDRETGVTIMKLDEGLDTGPLVAARSVPLDGTERTPPLTEELSRLGAELLATVLDRMARGESVPEAPQDEALATLCRPVTRDDGRIDWNRSASELDRRLRAFDPWPGVFTLLGGERVKILEASVGAHRGGGAGEILEIGKGDLLVATGDGSWRIGRLQPEGKAAMGAGDFARGRRLAPGSRFE